MTGSLLRSLAFYGGLSLGIISCRAITPAVMNPTERIPSGLFDALCESFVQAGHEPSATTLVLSETRPIFQTFALRILRNAGKMTPAEAEQDDARDRTLEERFRPTKIEVPGRDTGCAWDLADRPNAEYFGADRLMLELSNVVEDPFATRDEPRFGVFARLSIGGASGASWYWIDLKPRGESWQVTSVAELAISDG